MTDKAFDNIAQFKAAQPARWAGFAANEDFTIPLAAHLVRFAEIGNGQSVLDVACGTGVVAITAARLGAQVHGIDITSALLQHAEANAERAKYVVTFTEGDVEALPYADSTFDVVVSQFGHMFAPRPEVAVSEMLRVLKVGGRIAFSTWPPEHGMGKLFALMAKYQDRSSLENTVSPQPWLWGNPDIIRERLGELVTDLQFERQVAIDPVLSPAHAIADREANFGPLKQLVTQLASHPERLRELRMKLTSLVTETFSDNTLRQHYLISRAIKR